MPAAVVIPTSCRTAFTIRPGSATISAIGDTAPGVIGAVSTAAVLTVAANVVTAGAMSVRSGLAGSARPKLLSTSLVGDGAGARNMSTVAVMPGASVPAVTAFFE